MLSLLGIVEVAPVVTAPEVVCSVASVMGTLVVSMDDRSDAVDRYVLSCGLVPSGYVVVPIDGILEEPSVLSGKLTVGL